MGAVLFCALPWLAFDAARCVDGGEEERAARVARADQQHAWVLGSDDRAAYGGYLPEEI